MSERTPSPQSVVVPDPLWMMHVIGPDDIYPAPDHATAVQWCAYLNSEIAPKGPSVLCVAVPAIWTGTAEEHADGLAEAIKGWAVPTAPAPSSLAGGEVQEIIETLEALTKGPDHDEFDRGARAARLDALDMIRPLAALSPEAPARSVRKPDEMTENALRSRAKALLKLKGWRAGDKIHIHGMIELLTQFGMDVSESPEEDRCNHPECGCDFDEVCDAALTPRHEAPADTVTISRAEYDKLKSGYPGDPSLLHEAPAEGAGRADVLATMRDHYQFALTGPWPDIKTPNYALAGLFKMAGDEIERLRARSSAPEAREGGIREILRKQAADPKRYLNPTHAASDNVFVDHDPEARFIADDYAAIPPAAPRADKLRTGALHTTLMDTIREDLICQHSDAFTEEDGSELIIPSGCTPQSAFVKIDVSALADVALAALKAEGA